MPHLRQQVQLTFMCPEAKWYSRTGMQFFNDDLTFGDGETFPALKVDQTAVMDGSTVSVTNNGTAPVSAYVRFEGDGTNSMVNPTLTRDNWLESAVNTLSWSGTIGPNDVVEIDGESLSCTDRDNLTGLGS